MDADKQSLLFDENTLKAMCIDFLLKEHIDHYRLEDYVIINELKFLDGRRRADLVEVNGNLNAYEIKSDLDNLEKLADQLDDYKECFNTITIVTTRKHINEIKENYPSSIGILLAENNCIKYLRKPKPYKRFNNFSLASFLSGRQLNNFSRLLEIENRSKMTTTDKRIYISDALDTDVLLSAAIKNLKESYKSQYRRFLNNKSKSTMADEIALFSPDMIRE